MSDPRHDKVIDEATDASSPGGESVSGYGSGVPRTHRRNIVRVALAAVLSGRCLASAEHRQSFCMLPADHAPLAHDDCMGCTWTDADHWQPAAVDRMAGQVEAVRKLHYAADNDVTRTPVCETCHGKAGVHECGCWAPEDCQPVCGHCNEGDKGISVAYPCPTIRAIGSES